MTRLSLFSSPLLLGFENFERTFERLSKSGGDGYPPYNIEQTDADGLRITVAVAGFSQDQLSVSVEENQLIIRGKQGDSDDRVFLHRGIAARQFQRAFVLADGIEITAARLDNGMLNVDLVRPKPESLVRTIKIETAKPADDQPATVAVERKKSAGAG